MFSLLQPVSFSAVGAAKFVCVVTARVKMPDGSFQLTKKKVSVSSQQECDRLVLKKPSRIDFTLSSAEASDQEEPKQVKEDEDRLSGTATSYVNQQNNGPMHLTDTSAIKLAPTELVRSIDDR